MAGKDKPVSGEPVDQARQAEEIERLRHRLAEETFAAQLRETLTLAAATGTIAAPVTHSRLLEMIVETAAHVITARAASLFLIDRDTNELVFEVALGQKAEEVKKFRVPLGHGIAGYVAMTGQPMAISDAQHDPRQASDIAQNVGYTPNNILCVPLFYNEQIIGVLELLDKEGPNSFDTRDMEVLGFFANQAAVAIEQSRVQRNLMALMLNMIESVPDKPEPGKQEIKMQAQTFIANTEEDPAFRRALDLAQLVAHIASRGENEVKACQTILHGFAQYLDALLVPGMDW